MERKEQKMVVQVDAYTRVCLTMIAVLLTVVVIGLWADGVPRAEQAMAAKVIRNVPEPPSPGAQRVQILAAQKETIAKLAELIAVLKSGEVKVRVTEMPGQPAGGTNAAGPKK